MARILFLTTIPPPRIQELRPDWSNEMLPEYLLQQGASVTIKQWTDRDIIQTIHESDHVSFLWCEDYIKHPDAFRDFLGRVKTSLAGSGSSPCMMNHADLVDWNMDKKYLLEMQEAGFDIPKTEIVDAEQLSVSELQQRLRDFESFSPIVLKPTVSASSKKTRWIENPSNLSADDVEFLEACTRGSLQSSLIIQKFEPSIATGEYSFMFIGDKLTHAVLKAPKNNEFRCQPEFGGEETLVDMSTIEERTLSIVYAIFNTLKTRFGTGSTGEMGYVRIDGLVTDESAFRLMEIEAIEPHIYLEMDGLEEMASVMLRPS
ncbi:hypothetical protein ASPWEDRAFT_33429 [Aspergillus wentii DTO 134E9]|uniref:Prokaryotic glutathione synthetase ATP-binding domain-containing protein n=1 Tax=Aspergillus wentii DTO 134E9 TaxID=1073089 RepID=A0A1L9RYZ8_ASPWE|nr:uncharacterized protein ASPWEDRAFT_33429 [Aspergillus wentii DTO 134E9]KAI9932528.1 hypothetical protein MW887_008770 [Aspergillus wentii]OJJ40094.1 hypothetical protein ASPWEDRAFT_33429 [Aspergillus wentii DTO 134E9]